MSDIPEIKQDAWHYRLAYNSWPAKFTDLGTSFMAPVRNPKNLCTYMRQVVKPIVTTVSLILWIFGIVLTGYIILQFGVDWPEGILQTIFGEGIGIVAAILIVLATLVGVITWGLGALMLIVGAIGLVCWGVDSQIIEPRRERRGPDPEPSIITQWLKALHDKTCPLLTVEGYENVGNDRRYHECGDYDCKIQTNSGTGKCADHREDEE